MPDASVRPFLMFEGSAEEAMNFYVSLFPGAKVLDNLRYRANEAGAEGGSMPFRSRRHFRFSASATRKRRLAGFTQFSLSEALPSCPWMERFQPQVRLGKRPFRRFLAIKLAVL